MSKLTTVILYEYLYFVQGSRPCILSFALGYDVGLCYVHILPTLLSVEVVLYSLYGEL